MSRNLSDYIWLVAFFLFLSCKSDHKQVDSIIIPTKNIDADLTMNSNHAYQDSLLPLEETYYPIPLDKWPTFPDGQNGLNKFLKQNLRYPKTNACVSGAVYVSFLIKEDGTVTEVKIAKGIHQDYDDEAMRVVKRMPPWKPGVQSGRPVPVRFTLPIRVGLVAEKIVSPED